MPVGEFEGEASGDGAAGVLHRLKWPAPARLVAGNARNRLGDEPAGATPLDAPGFQGIGELRLAVLVARFGVRLSLPYREVRLGAIGLLNVRHRWVSFSLAGVRAT